MSSLQSEAGAALKSPPGGSDKKRLFVAISLPEPILIAVAELQSELKRYARDAKWVRPEGIHLTLKFLGYVEIDRIEAIGNTLTGVANVSPPLSIDVRGCGAFPNSRRPNVLWAGVESEHLGGVQIRVEEALVELGFEKENRPFSPHLTLARFRDPHGLAPLMLQVEKKKDLPLGHFTASRLKLFESILHREGAEYHVLKEFLLEGTQWM